jgi:hypothetical protein
LSVLIVSLDPDEIVSDRSSDMARRTVRSLSEAGPSEAVAGAKAIRSELAGIKEPDGFRYAANIGPLFRSF